MKIKTLNLIAFGKFHNRTIEVSDGLNLIFGGNEAGKSTIQHFIEGMLFGFYKPYRKKRIYNEDYYRFKPRQGDAYFGTMIMEDGMGRDIRIERDFLKSRDGVRIFDNVTGEDISATFPYDSVTRQYLPLGYGGFNSVMFNNTVNVKQMASKSDKDLAREVNDRLVDMVTETGDDISVNKVLNYLDKKRSAVGSSGKSKSNYGMAVREMHNLEGILEESEGVFEQIRKNQKRIQQYKKKIQQAQSQVDEYKKNAEAKSRRSQEAMQEKLDAIKAEGDAIQEQIRRLSRYERLDSRVYGRLQVLQDSLNASSRRLSTIHRQMDQLEDEQKELDARCTRFEKSLNGFTREEIDADYEAYQTSIAARAKGEAAAASTLGTAAKRKRKPAQSDYVSFAGLSQIPLIIAIVIGFLLVGISVANPGSLLGGAVQTILSFVGLVLGVGGCVILALKNREANAEGQLPEPEAADEDEAEAIEEYVGEDDALDSDWDSEEDDWTDEWFDEDDEDLGDEAEVPVTCDPQEILAKYGREDDASYQSFMERCREVFARYDKLKARSQSIDEKLTELSLEKEEAENDRKGFRASIDKALQDAGVDSIDAYGEGCEKGADIGKLRAQLDANRRLYDELAQGSFMPVSAAAVLEDPVLMTDGDGGEIRVREAIEAFNHEVARIQGENTSLMSGVGNPVEIRERIETLKHQIDSYEAEIRACDLAQKFFTGYSRKMHYDKAPDLNDKIGRIIGAITGKYHEVRVDDHLNIRVVDPENGSLLAMEQLSGGTVDQIYLALRFGVTGMVDQEKAMPIILDDPFVQYDDNRKAEAIKYISSLTPETQVLLFTCTADEKRILDEYGYEYIGIGI